MLMSDEEVYDYLDAMPLDEKIARLSTKHWIKFEDEEYEE